MDEIIVDIKSIVPEGKGFGLFESKPVYIDGVLPGEKVKAQIFRKKKNYYHAKLIEIINQSEFRVAPKEAHYLSCSPWQVINYSFQCELKKNIIRKCFDSLAKTELDEFEFVSAEKIFNYRNKIEFSFGEKDHSVFLAFHERGSHKKMVELPEGCILGDELINQKSLNILQIIQKSDIEEFDLKSLVIRSSCYENKAIALLLVKNEKERVQNLINCFKKNQVEDFVIALSSYKSPLPTIDKILFKNGDLVLHEKVNNLILEYSIGSFFQNNISLFEKALEDIKKYVSQEDRVLELYSGVGSIGLAISGKVKSILGVEIVEEAVNCAKRNAKKNEIYNYDAILSASEKINSSIFQNVSTLIVDPPRSGLHKKVRKLILENKPKKIIYLSCNPITQASDFNYLKEFYKLKFIKGYDFYPNTPHIENLIILERK